MFVNLNNDTYKVLVNHAGTVYGLMHVLKETLSKLGKQHYHVIANHTKLDLLITAEIMDAVDKSAKSTMRNARLDPKNPTINMLLVSTEKTINEQITDRDFEIRLVVNPSIKENIVRTSNSYCVRDEEYLFKQDSKSLPIHVLFLVQPHTEIESDLTKLTEYNKALSELEQCEEDIKDLVVNAADIESMPSYIGKGLQGTVVPLDSIRKLTYTSSMIIEYRDNQHISSVVSENTIKELGRLSKLLTA